MNVEYLTFAVNKELYERFLKVIEYTGQEKSGRYNVIANVLLEWVEKQEEIQFMCDQHEKIKYCEPEDDLSTSSPFGNVKVGDHVTIQDRSIYYGNNTHYEFKEQVLDVSEDNIYTESNYVFSKANGEIMGHVNTDDIPASIAEYVLVDPNPPEIDPNMPLSFVSIWKHIQRLDKRIDSLAVVNPPDIISPLHETKSSLHEELMNWIAVLKEKIKEIKPGDTVYVLENSSDLGTVERDVIAVTDTTFEIKGRIHFDKNTLMVVGWQQISGILFADKDISHWMITGLKFQKQ